jgi:hypothetical protein
MLQGNELEKARGEVALARSLTALLMAARLKVAEDRKREAQRLVLGGSNAPDAPERRSA